MRARGSGVMSVAGVGKIQVLPGEVVSRIAAGEVVERPAAVVKELIDNSLDAGSTRITIEVTDGGRRMIKVTDDGEGMGQADALLAFQRHATSKLRSEEDLLGIRTLGFRGEALPSIASVSKVRMVTACRHEPVGTRMLVTGGTITKTEEAAAAPGTQIEITDLFFNTPARRKFLKASTTEFSHLCQIVQQAALAWPRTQFRLRHNGRDVLEYSPVSSLRDRVLQIYGARFLKDIIAVREERPGFLLEGFTVNPVRTRAGRSPQDLFVNRRPVKNATVAHAVYDGYGGHLSKGQHPVFVLFLAVDPDRVDVNVHPTKREVRFADQDMIHQSVRQVIRGALRGRSEELGMPIPPDSRGEWPRPGSTAAGEPPHDATILEEHLADLATLGLELESFGANSFVIRAVPALLGQFDYSTLVQDLVEDLAQWNAASSLETRVRPVLASLACHGAVRAGRALDPSESKRLIEDWVEESLPMTCPHGRRVALRLPAEELART